MDLSGWRADMQKLLLLLLATQNLAGQDPSMDPRGDSDGSRELIDSYRESQKLH
jgi:hypothetical protein